MIYQIKNGAVEFGADIILRRINFEIRDTEKIAIVGGRDEPNELVAPCGVCRQVMAEFCGDDFKVVLGNSKNLKVFSLKEILPYSFTKSSL